MFNTRRRRSVRFYSTEERELNGPFCGQQRYKLEFVSHRVGSRGVLPVVETRIIGGVKADNHEFPWIVSLNKPKTGSGYSHYCAGAIISDYYILTAAHCSDNFVGKESELRVNIGTNYINDFSKGVVMRVEEIIIHEHWSRDTGFNDIALYKTVVPIKYSINQNSGQYIVNSICLPEVDDLAPVDGLVAGWGQTSTKEQTIDHLMKVNVPNYALKECQQNYKNYGIVNQYMLCYGGRGGKDSCNGDSGGPLMEKRGNKYYVIGIVSFGIPCGVRDYPTVYTKLTKYLNWIEKHIKS